jgi:hypothetical protein
LQKFKFPKKRIIQFQQPQSLARKSFIHCASFRGFLLVLLLSFDTATLRGISMDAFLLFYSSLFFL